MGIETKQEDDLTIEQLSGYSEDELLDKYGEYEEESEEFQLIKAELGNRGYSFEAPTVPEAAPRTFMTEPVLPDTAVPSPSLLKYSDAGSITWGAVFLLLAVIGAKVGGVRRLANMKGNSTSKGNIAFPGYLVLMLLGLSVLSPASITLGIYLSKWLTIASNMPCMLRLSHC